MNPAEHLALNVSGACFGESQRVTEFSLKEHTQCLTHSTTKSRSGHSKEELNIQKMKIMASGPIISWQIDEETVEAVADFILGGLQKSVQMVTAAMILKDACSLEEKL